MTNIDIRMKKEDIKEINFSFVSSFFLAGWGLSFRQISRIRQSGIIK